MATQHKICDACETVEHCTRHGCIPVQPLTRIDRLPAARQAASVDLVKAAAHDMLATLELVNSFFKSIAPGDNLLVYSHQVRTIQSTTHRVINLAKGINK